jgi:hypothetical protein
MPSGKTVDITSSSKRRTGTLIAFVVGGLMTPGFALLAEPALSGHVTDQRGQPLPGATVSIHKISGEPFEATVRTDVDGTFSVSEMPDGDYSIRADFTGFVSTAFEPVRIYFPSHLRWDITLRIGYFGGEGGVFSNSELVGELMLKGRRLPNAAVCLTRESPDPVSKPVCTQTNRLGQYLIAVPPAEYRVSVVDGGRTLVTRDLNLKVAGQYRNKINPDTTEK